MKTLKNLTGKKAKTLIHIPPVGLQGTLIRSCQCLMWGLCFLSVSALQNGGTLRRTGSDPPSGCGGLTVVAPLNACTQIAPGGACMVFQVVHNAWKSDREKNGLEVFLGCIISQTTIIVSQRFGDPKMSPGTRCWRTLIVTLKDRSLLF